jgi:pyridoxamine 5'-phosphate oxidase
MKDTREKVKHIRRDYDQDSLSDHEAPDSPIELFRDWLDDALESGIKEPNAFVLSTYANQEVDSRVVLLREFSEAGVQFFTNYGSQKGKEMEQNPQASINFFWADLDRQIRMKAKIKKLDKASSDEYFASRPRESQIGAWASQQSQTLSSREELEERVSKYTKEFEGKEVPRPEFWGGYLAEVYYYEFWQGRQSRLHDRIVYEAKDGAWLKKRLYP